MNKILKSCMTAIAALALAVGFAVAPASAAAVSVGRLSVERTYNSQDGSFNAYSGESISIYTYYTVNMTSVNAGEILTFAETAGQVTGLSRTWMYTASGAPSPTSGGTNATFTIPSPKPAGITLTVQKTFVPSSSGVVNYLPTVTSNGSGVTFTDRYSVISINLNSSASGYTAKTGDSNLNYNFDVCVDMGLVAPSDTIELSTAMSTPSPTNSYPGFTDWTAGSTPLSATGSETSVQRTIPNPEPATLKASFYRAFNGLTPGVTYTFSADIKKGAASVTLASCPAGGGGGGGGGGSLYPLGGASLSGNLTVGSVLTATQSRWSLTAGGAEITPISSNFRWYVCDAPHVNSSDMGHADFLTLPACFTGGNPLNRVLADGESLGSSGTSYGAATLTLTQNLLNALNGKYLAVMANATAAGSIFGNQLLPTCGAFGTATTCSVSDGGTPPVVAPPVAAPPALAPQAPAGAIPAAVKAKKKLSIPAKTAAGLPVKVVASGGCKVKPVVKTVTTKVVVGKKTKKVKTKVTTGYTVTMGNKGTTCTITQSNSGDATYDALNSVSTVAAS